MSTGGVDETENLEAALKAMEALSREAELEELDLEQHTSEESVQVGLTRTVWTSKTEETEKSLKGRAGAIAKLKELLEDKQMLPIAKLKSLADKYERRNPELKSAVLILLRERVKSGDTPEDILRTLQEFYPDVSLADEALEYLLETTEGPLKEAVQKAKDLLNEEKGREIAAGRNITSQARVAAEKGLGTPTTLRDLYRDITGKTRDANTLFDELAEKYAFKELQKVIDFLLHSLGSDMKAKGPSIPRGQLHDLVSETRILQAILGVYRFFQGRMHLMQKLFEENELPFPETLSFETMAKAFMSLVQERYPSADKALSTAKRLELEDWILAKIIALSQFRDAIKQVAWSQIYRSLQHRDDLLLSILEALEDLEDELEAKEEEEEEEIGPQEKEEGE